MMSVRFEELTRGELRDLAPKSTVVVPVGSTEQHGPHLPVWVDTAVVAHIALQAAEIATAEIPVVVTPTLPFGIAHHHLPFGGTISISAQAYLDVLTDIGGSLVTGGFRRIVFLNGHGGNSSTVSQAADRLVYERKLDVHVSGISYWTCASEVLAALDLGGVPKPGHAGAFETSLIMALQPELVRTDLVPVPETELKPLSKQAGTAATIRHPDIWLDSDGRTDDSSRATAEIGKRTLLEIANSVAKFLVTFHRDSDRVSSYGQRATG